jgi:hypothetical protein
MQVFHFSFSVNGAVPPKAAATALADGADAVGTRREQRLQVALADAPWHKGRTAALFGGADPPKATAAAGHPDGADVATAKMFAKISGAYAKSSEDASEDCRSERILCANASRQAREYMLAAAKALAKAAAMQQAAPALRPPKQAAVVKKAAPRPSAKKAAAFQKAPPLRHPKQAAAMMKATVPKKAAPPRIRLARVAPKAI